MTLPQATRLDITAPMPSSYAEIVSADRDRKKKWKEMALRAAPKLEEVKAAPKPPVKVKEKPQTLYGQVSQLLRQGVMQARIHDTTGVSTKKIREIARRLGIPTTNRPTCATHIVKIKELHDAGVSCRGIAFDLGISPGAMIKFIRKQDWPRDAVRPPIQSDAKIIRELFDQGLSMKEIGRRTGWDNRWVGRFVQSQGWER